MQSRLRMALEAFVRAQQGPLILFVEDLHWADDTTIDLVDWLLGCPDLRFGVFASRGPRSSRACRSSGSAATSRGSRLAALAARGRAPRRRRAPERRSRRARQHRAPRRRQRLFLEELVRCAADGREELPLTVQALVQLRLDRMSPEAREVLRAGAVFGQSFWTGGVEALLDRDAVLDLAELQQSEILTRQTESRIAGQDEWIFRQALVRDAAYASILEEDRAALHLDAGGWL